ncbi:MAG: YqgE/AlgH family protein [Granulosicoccus sp.]|nr:YqgE/AlgH family protein [Granulosicoccus sp.]
MNLTHHFLLSMPQMHDSDFRDSVVYILDHGDHGAFGVIINQELGMTLSGVFAQMAIHCNDETVNEQGILRGGPVDEGHGLVLHAPGPQFESTRDFEGGVSLSTSRDILEALARGDTPHEYLVLLGHAGWAPGQLEMEIANNAWLTSAADTQTIFLTPLAQRRQAVGNLLGIDLAQMVGHSGHA